MGFTLLQLSQTGHFMVTAGLFFFPLIVAVITCKDIFYNKNIKESVKIFWFALVILIPLFGPIIYYFWGKPSAERKNLKP
ncbi:hypothetical protein Pedsa_2982 [Pseudopedobacter saltans DSM 12145]|uniref:Cardiolipin synthase N-terminal domain-containing protein n=1 Tax=Pseudopedobacter saltans (strain ATCC 51119 / DSM 12145 / JCM 21818 / CCUG 39354 / LMG 10337 / NBRC 100064 / NCIMB 13643) TaxID=762903 RepID=F0S9G8_PSESL|nr:PLD nuclease N-terminal domain-containing protein [Pseudopedobacter saltans]ADY53521.1 hypothetical protein Pedsa_2982 [Pseudopedobacter saltans DSM 12145]